MIMRIPLLRTVCKAIVAKADWDESKHPRADNGQFGSGSGGSSKPKKPSKTRRKMERREEAASQARVGGAIQSLLSGGSALDKIGWLSTSQKEPEKPATKPKEEAAPAKEPSRQEAPQQPEKPKAEEKPKEESDVDRHQRLQAERKQFIQDSSAKLLANLRSGKVTPEDAEKVKRELGHKSFDLVRETRSMKDGKELDAKIAEGKHIDDKIEAIDAALKAHKDEQPTKPIDWSKVRSKPGGSSVRDDPLPKGYGVRSPEETERYMREHPRKPPKPDDYEEDYKRRTGRDWDPTTA